MMDKTVLLVDDEEDIRTVLGVALSDFGYTVLTAENGREGLSIFREKAPPIVVTDIKMPDIDGVDLLRQIKNENPDTEVIMITGHGDMDVAIQSFKHQATDFITKPINVETLEAALDRVQDKIQARQELRDYTYNLEELAYEKSEKLAGFERLLEGEQDLAHLKDLQQRFQALFYDLPCYVTVQDNDLILTSINKLFVQDFGERLGSSCYKVFKHSDEPCIDCPVQKTFDQGQPQQSETELISKDGDKLSVMVWTAPVRDAEDVITHVLVMYTDMTQVLKVQDHLSSLGLLIGSISHSIKGMLTGLDGGMYLLDSGLKKQNDDQVKEGLNIVKLMVSRIRNIVLDVLLFSKDRDLKKETLAIADFAREVAGVVQPKARERSIEFVFDCKTAKGECEADPAFLRTALVNVLENAIDACIANQDTQPGRIEFNVTSDDDQAVFEIIDNGIGMDEDTQKNMFTLFFSSKEKKGTGLGLYITNKTIQQHGGEIAVESEPGQGSRLLIKIPKTV